MAHSDVPPDPAATTTAPPPPDPVSELPPEAFAELAAAVRGPVLRRGDPEFTKHTTLFNGNVVSRARAVVLPLDTADVGAALRVCVAHGLSPSVKAGGYGTAGWAIAGDVMLDLARLADLAIEPPRAGGGFVRMRDMPPPGAQASDASHARAGEGPDKGKARVGAGDVGKRRRSPDAQPGSRAVAEFLRGDLDLPSPSVRRRVDPNEPAAVDEGAEIPRPTDAARARDTDSPMGEERPALIPTAQPISTLFIPPTPQPQSRSLTSSDPFSYLSTPAPQSTYPAPTYRARPPAISTAAGAGPSRATLPQWAPVPVPMPSAPAPLHTHAYVTFGAGAGMRAVDAFTAAHPLPATDYSGRPCEVAYHVPMAAHPVGSSVMLLAGFGFLSRLHGLSVDALVEVEMVLADGRIVTASADENTDLWWAIRGAGPAFGVATRYKAKAYPVPVVFAGNLIYDFHAATAPSLVKHFRDCVKGAPRELYANVLFTAGPAGAGALIVVQLCFAGTRARGLEFLHAVSAWDGARCVLNEVDEKSFLHQQDSVAQILRGKAGRQWYIRSALITSLPDDIIHKTVQRFADAPTGCTWLFELAGGAVADADDTCLPRAQREAAFTVAAFHQWELGVDDPRCVAAAEEWICETLAPVATGGPYPSFLGRNERPERAMASFGENWPRLCELKRKYDPTGLFRNTFWPVDVDMLPVDARTHEPPSP